MGNKPQHPPLCASGAAIANGQESETCDVQDVHFIFDSYGFGGHVRTALGG